MSVTSKARTTKKADVNWKMAGATFIFFAVYYFFACDPADRIAEKWFLEKASGGIGTILIQNEGGFYPLIRLGALFGENGLRALAMLGPALWLWKLIVLHGYTRGIACWLPMVIPLGVFANIGSTSHIGHFGVAVNCHFNFMIYGLILLTSAKELTKTDMWILCVGTITGGVAGILAPFMLLKKPVPRALLLSCLLGGLLLAYLGIKKITPRDCSLAPQSEHMTRSVSFDMATYLAAVTTQSLIGPALPKEKAVQLTELIQSYGAPDNQKYIWWTAGLLGSGWLLLLFGGGWRFALGVIGCSMMTFAFSWPKIKGELIAYPYHTQYLNWISGMLGVGAVLWISKHYEQVRLSMRRRRLARQSAKQNRF